MMNLIFEDLQESCNPNNNKLLMESEIDLLFESFADREPFMFQLRGPNDATLTVGLAKSCGCVQYSQGTGGLPYCMAVNDFECEDGYVEFLVGGTPTPIENRFCLPFDDVRRIVLDFVKNSDRTETVNWEEI